MNRKKVIVTALVGTIALAALSVSISLAWYGASDRLGISSLDVSMSTEADLKVSTKSDLDSFKNDLDLNVSEKLWFSPVSSMYNSFWQSQKADSPVFYDCSSSLVPSNGEPALETRAGGDGFFQTELYFITNLKDYYVTLDIDKCEFKNNDNYVRAQNIYNELQEQHKNDSTWSDSEQNLSISEIQDKLDNLLNSLRISILVLDEKDYNYYIIDPMKQSGDVTYYGGRLDNNRDGFYDTYETRMGDSLIEKEVIYGEVNNRDLVAYDDPVHGAHGDGQPSEQNFEEHYEPVFFGNSFNAISKDTAFTYNADDSATNGLKIEKEKSLSQSDIRNDQNSILIPCYKDVPSKVIMSIYLEGWDLDCINATMGASFKTKLSFKLLRGIN